MLSHNHIYKAVV